MPLSPWARWVLGLWAPGEGSDEGVRGPVLSEQDWWYNCGVHVSEPDLLSGKDETVNSWLRWYGSPLWLTEDMWYRSRGRRTEQIQQLPQPNDHSKHLGKWSLKIWLYQPMGIGEFPRPWTGKVDCISRLWNHLGRILAACTTGPWVDVGRPYFIPGYWGSWKVGYDFSCYILPSPDTGRRNSKFGNNDHAHFSLTFNLILPTLLSDANIIKIKTTMKARGGGRWEKERFAHS